MISHKDMTFCNSNCGNMECPRKLTPQVVNDADAWFIPIAIANFTEGCESYQEEEDYEQDS
jgi:hypothetical protein